jgi:hypothetical protein
MAEHKLEKITSHHDGVLVEFKNGVVLFLTEQNLWAIAEMRINQEKEKILNV